MNLSGDFPPQLQFRPSKLAGSPDVPCPLLEGQLRFQNDHVLRPTDDHGFSQHLRYVLICPVKLPHPAEVPGGKAGDTRVCSSQVLSGGHSRAFFRLSADEFTDFPVKFHLRQICSN